MVSITYKPAIGPVVTEVYTDRKDLAKQLCIDPRTLNRWLRGGNVKHEEYRLRFDNIVTDVMLSEDVHYYGSNRGCPKGENRFLKKK